MRNFISFNQSLNILDNIALNSSCTQKLFITQALNHILAQDIVARENSPAYPTSAMDGYAVRFKDQTLSELSIIDKNPAGSITECIVSKGVCIKTFTGSLMPQGSDTLIPIENVTVDGHMLKITQKVTEGFAVRNIGENYKVNEILIKKGSKIGFAEIGVLASLNISQVLVYANPTVAIASTGSEILDLGEKQTNASQIRSSNHLTLEALAKNSSANVIQMGTVKDDIYSITQLLQKGLNKADILVTTGGVSVGDYDFVQDVVKHRLGAKVLFHGVNIKPGMHILIAQKENKFIIALPGFAYSSTVCAIVYMLKMIYKFRNGNEQLQIVQAKIRHDRPKKIPKTIFSACNVCYENGEYWVDFENKKEGSSAILTNILGNSALMIQKEDSKDLKANDTVDIILLNGL
jgi:molybdopterin molybdotransferase